MTTPEVDQEFTRLYEEAEFDQQYREAVKAALRRIDAARAALIDAQNNLAYVLDGSNDFTRAKFAAFYRNGGVTEIDWAAWQGAPRRHCPDRGQLRVVGRMKA